MGFGVGVCPALPLGYTPLGGNDRTGPSDGNYRYQDGSIMVWVPAVYYQIGSALSPLYAVYGANAVDVLPLRSFADTSAANAAGYTLHRAFYDGGFTQPGFFIDK